MHDNYNHDFVFVMLYITQNLKSQPIRNGRVDYPEYQL